MDPIPNEQPKIPPTTGSSGLGLLWDFVKVIIIAAVIIIPIRFFVFQPFIVSGSSMEPNFQNNQYLVIDELSYHFTNPQRGDVIVLHYPKDPKEFFIKRIIGLPGEKVEIDNGHVTIFNAQNPNGMVLDEPYLPSQNISYPHDPSIVGGSNILTLGPNQYFMMGDNRLASSDSRDWGVLDRNLMVGKVFLRLLPLNELHVYTQGPSYSS